MTWDKSSLFEKAKVKIQKGYSSAESDPTDFPLWCSLGLELLGRAALSHVSPTLNADPSRDEGNNILHALGIAGAKGQPRSIGAQAVWKRLSIVCQEFKDNKCAEFCEYFAALRNEELHGDQCPFEQIKTTKWLPRFYQTCDILCRFMDIHKMDLLPPSFSDEADQHIESLALDIKSKVKSDIATCQTFYRKLSDSEKKHRELAFQAQRAIRDSHAMKCPACGCTALLRGNEVSRSEPSYDGEMFYATVTFRADSLVCMHCGLNLNGTAMLSEADVEITFQGREHLDLHDFFQPEFEQEYDNM